MWKSSYDKKYNQYLNALQPPGQSYLVTRQFMNQTSSVQRVKIKLDEFHNSFTMFCIKSDNWKSSTTITN